MNRFTWLWVVALVCAVSATGCGLVLDTQERDDAGSDADTGETDGGATDGGEADGDVHQCDSPSDCDDHSVCNGSEDCVDHRCVGTDFIMDCEDGVRCTLDQCDPLDGCTHTPNDAVCDSIGGYCDPEEDCQPLPGCTSSTDCPPATPCQGLYECLNEECVRRPRLECPTVGTCLVGTCAVDRCVYAPSAALCNTDPLSCAVRTCQVDGGQCSAPTLNHAFCDDGFACTTDTCGTAGQVNAARCQHTNVHSVCEDGIACTLNVCAKDDRTADSRGCAIRLNDQLCANVSDDRDCVQPVCVATGCEDVVREDLCHNGSVCNFDNGLCQYPEGCPDNCADFGNPCAPATCNGTTCVAATVDPCVSTLPCAIGFCDISDTTPRCAIRLDPMCLPVIGTLP